MIYRTRRGWLAGAASGAVGAALLAFTVVPVAEQPVFAQTGGPTEGLTGSASSFASSSPGTEMSTIDNGFTASIPPSLSSTNVQMQVEDYSVQATVPANPVSTTQVHLTAETRADGALQLDVAGVAGPVSVQIQGPPGGLSVYDELGNPLSVTEVAPGTYQVTLQP